MPQPKTALYRANDAADFFGGPPGAIDLECIGDWQTYVQKWPSIPATMKALGIGKFWSDPAVSKLIFGLPDAAKQLRSYALWWADMPTSTVSVERTFGIMRTMESQQRLSLSAEAVDIELKAKMNSWIVDGILKSFADSLPSPPPLK